jgi:hypothetical protein
VSIWCRFLESTRQGSYPTSPKPDFWIGIVSECPVIQAQSRKAVANRLRTMSLLGVPDFKSEWFRATPMAPYTHFHEFAFVRRSTYAQGHEFIALAACHVTSYRLRAADSHR